MSSPSITRDELFFILDDFTGASTQSIESLKKLLDQIVFNDRTKIVVRVGEGRE